MTPRQPRQKTHEIVADKLRQKIVSGELRPGDRLPSEDELTAQLGVARTTLREGLRLLESQGLLSIRRGRGGGPVVTRPDLSPVSTALATFLLLQKTSVGDLDAARRMIEPQIAGQLARAHTDEDIAALTEAIDAAEVAAIAFDTEAFGRAAAHVHETLVARSGNSTLRTLSQLLQGMIYGYYARSMHRVQHEAMLRAIRSYRRLVSYIVAGDADAAIDHWRKQMSYTVGGHDPAEPISVASRL